MLMRPALSAGLLDDRTRAANRAVVATALITCALALTACGGPDNGASSTVRDCGTKRLYAKTLRIHVVGAALGCSDVRAIIRGNCRPAKVWSCFLFRAPDPLLVWFRESERFKRSFSTAIEARRYPCSQAAVTAQAWADARRRRSGFPTEQQVLTDDLIRCRLLAEMSEHQVRALLGRPDASSSEKAKRYLDYDVGPERDSFFQLDNEVLSIRFGPDGRVEKAELYQS